MRKRVIHMVESRMTWIIQSDCFDSIHSIIEISIMFNTRKQYNFRQLMLRNYVLLSNVKYGRTVCRRLNLIEGLNSDMMSLSLHIIRKRIMFN
jgi:hypothetical protein